MPYYRYNATDSQGKAVEGTVQASTPQEASATLTQRGFKVRQIVDTRSIAQAAPGAAPAQQTAAGPTIRTRAGSDKDRFFLFSQLSDLFKAGVPPVQALEGLGQRMSHTGFKRSLEHAANSARNGGAISEVFAQYPYLYPPHVIGTMRAAETAGFLPEALARISAQAEEAHKFRRMLWLFWAVAINFLLTVPLAIGFTRGLLHAFRLHEEGRGGGLQLVLQGIWEKLVWPWGPIALGTWFGVWLLLKILGSMRFRNFRHRLGLRVPIYGKRAKHECLAIFSWVLAKVSHAGLPPNRAWEMATSAVPNIEMQEVLERVGARFGEGRRFSDVIFESRLFPEEYAPMMATAEMTGDIPKVLDQMAHMSGKDYENQTAYAKLRTGGFSCCGCVGTWGAVAIVLAYFYYRELINTVLEGLEP
jgi:type II secretory pathway component PulF